MKGNLFLGDFSFFQLVPTKLKLIEQQIAATEMNLLKENCRIEMKARK